MEAKWEILYDYGWRNWHIKVERLNCFWGARRATNTQPFSLTKKSGNHLPWHLPWCCNYLVHIDMCPIDQLVWPVFSKCTPQTSLYTHNAMRPGVSVTDWLIDFFYNLCATWAHRLDWMGLLAWLWLKTYCTKGALASGLAKIME